MAALLDAAQASEIIEVVSPDTFKRPIYAGNAIQTVQSTDTNKVITVPTTSFPSASQGNAAAVENISAAADPGLSIFIENKLFETDCPELISPKIVISGGRALCSSEKILGSHPARRRQARCRRRRFPRRGRRRLRAQRPACRPDRKVVAPNLYTAVGISGAIQHLAGMKGTRRPLSPSTRDEEAPIFQVVADYASSATFSLSYPSSPDRI
ncbi:FAD-binding protein [Mesorhizobium sp. M1328]